METKIEKKDNIINVFAKFLEKRGTEQKLRFYSSDALEMAKQFDSSLEFLPTPDLCLTITNYVKPFEGIWTFEIKKTVSELLPNEKNNEVEIVIDKKNKRDKKKEDMNGG